MVCNNNLEPLNSSAARIHETGPAGKVWVTFCAKSFCLVYFSDIMALSDVQKETGITDKDRRVVWSNRGGKAKVRH